MAEADEDFAKRWRTKADQAITQGQKIPVDQDIYEWLGEAPKGATSQGTKRGHSKPAQRIRPHHKETGRRRKAPAAQAGDLRLANRLPREVAPLVQNAGADPGSDYNPPRKPRTRKKSEDLLQKPRPIPRMKQGRALQRLPSEREVSDNQPAIPAKEEKKAERKKPKGYFPAEKLWDKTVGEVQDEWSAFMADYEDIKAKTEKEIEPLRKELESLKGKRDKFSNARKKEIQKQIGQKEEIYKSIPAQAENGLPG